MFLKSSRKIVSVAIRLIQIFFSFLRGDQSFTSPTQKYEQWLKHPDYNQDWTWCNPISESVFVLNNPFSRLEPIHYPNSDQITPEQLGPDWVWPSTLYSATQPLWFLHISYQTNLFYYPCLGLHFSNLFVKHKFTNCSWSVYRKSNWLNE